MTIRAIDLFAGAGGFTTGATQAGAEVVWAANHWPAAVRAHELNHPETVHACQDLQQANFHECPDFQVLLASPACQGHSPARGKERPHHDATRSTAWAVIAAVEAKQPEVVVVENVPHYRRWKLFPIWRDALVAYGYHLTEHVIDAADCGVPQNRERLFLVASRVGRIDVPQPTAPHVAARTFVDVDGGQWSPVRKPGRAARTLKQIEAGWAEFGDEPFLAPYYGSGSGLKGRSLDRPIGTVRTRDAWAVVRGGEGGEMRMLTPTEYQAAMGFPAEYDLGGGSKAQRVHLLGNAVVPAAARHVVGSVIEALA